MSSLYPEIGEKCYHHDLDGEVDKVVVVDVQRKHRPYTEYLVEFFDGTRRWVSENGLRRE